MDGPLTRVCVATRSGPRSWKVVAMTSRTWAVPLLFVVACRDPEPRDAKTAADLASYTAALEDCLQKGNAAKSREVYRECADGVERKWGSR